MQGTRSFKNVSTATVKFQSEPTILSGKMYASLLNAPRWLKLLAKKSYPVVIVVVVLRMKINVCLALTRNALKRTKRNVKMDKL